MRGYIRALAAATGGVTSVLVGSGVYTSRTVNMRRKRYYTDDFHMTPETLCMRSRRCSSCEVGTE